MGIQSGVLVLYKRTSDWYAKLTIDQKFQFCYNYDTMKAIQFKIQPPRERRHRALFDQDLPFRARVERPKTEYRRKPKHTKRDCYESA